MTRSGQHVLMATMTSIPRREPAAALLLVVLASMFLLSGISGLVYQVLWMRLLSLTLGVTVWAASAVLGSYMAGLAIGSLIGGRLADRSRRPLVWYGVVELLIVLCGIGSPWALDAAESLFVSLAPVLPDSFAALTSVRVVLAFAVLLIPTTLLGATSPLLFTVVARRDQRFAERVSLLYAANTAGAVVGTLITAFFLVGRFGMSASFGMAASINLLVGLIAIFLSIDRRQAPQVSGSLPDPHPLPTAVLPGSLSNRRRWLVLLIFSISGFVTLSLEVVWLRVLVLYLPGTVYLFALILAVVLVGITAGSFLVQPLLRRGGDLWLALASLEIVIGISTLLSIAPLARFPGAVEALRPHLTEINVFALLPTALALGAAWPIGLRLWVSESQGRRTGGQVGAFYSCNLLGALVGSLAAGFLLLPILGSQYSLILLAALSFAGGMALLPVTRPRSTATVVGTLGVATFVVAAVTTPDPFQALLAQRYPNLELLWSREGVQGTVTVHQLSDGARVLLKDGSHEADDRALIVLKH